MGCGAAKRETPTCPEARAMEASSILTGGIVRLDEGQRLAYSMMVLVFGVGGKTDGQKCDACHIRYSIMT